MVGFLFLSCWPKCQEARIDSAWRCQSELASVRRYLVSRNSVAALYHCYSRSKPGEAEGWQPVSVLGQRGVAQQVTSDWL